MNKNSTHDVFGNKFYTSVGYQCLQSYVVYVLLGASEGLRERTEHLDIFLFFSACHSVVFCFRCSVYWWKGSVRF